MGNDIETRFEQAQVEISYLQSELDNAKDEIDVLQGEIDGFDSRLKDAFSNAFSEGYQEAIDNMKYKLEEIE